MSQSKDAERYHCVVLLRPVNPRRGRGNLRGTCGSRIADRKGEVAGKKGLAFRWLPLPLASPRNCRTLVFCHWFPKHLRTFGNLWIFIFILNTYPAIQFVQVAPTVIINATTDMRCYKYPLLYVFAIFLFCSFELLLQVVCLFARIARRKIICSRLNVDGYYCPP